MNETSIDPRVWWAAGGAALLVLVVLLVIWRKGRPFAPGDVFRASRLSGGNRLFPTQVLISPTSVVHFTPEWFGRLEHSMHMAHVASVRIDTNLMFSDAVHRDDWRSRPDPVPRAQESGRHPHAAADREISDGLLQSETHDPCVGFLTSSSDPIPNPKPLIPTPHPLWSCQSASDNETGKQLWMI